MATSKGDFRWTIMVERCFVAGEEFGEKAAIVGGFGSLLGVGFADSFSRAFIDGEAISVTQGVSRWSA